MRKIVVCLGIVLFMLTLVVKQTDAQIVNSAFKRNDILQKKPMPLPTNQTIKWTG